jgi:ABC-type Zn uptake system ZnuABC Zn-binding protein ZnuA
MPVKCSENILFLFTMLLGLALNANAKVQVVASLPDLGSIAAYIGGDRVEVSSIAKASTNPHSVEVFPSFLAKVSQASLYLKCGMSLDTWADGIIDGSRNNHLATVDCSQGITALEKPSGKVDASLGDVHPDGNPHYWLNPANGIIIARNITEGLGKTDPSHGPYYASQLEKFRQECQEKTASWRGKMKPFNGSKIISYHSSWIYFADAFGLSVIARVEPFPGIPPTGNHLAELVEVIKRDQIAFILQEPYFSDQATRFLNRQTGVKVYKCAPACPDVKPSSYFGHFDDLINQITGITEGK